jgi:hypothetical protein
MRWFTKLNPWKPLLFTPKSLGFTGEKIFPKYGETMRNIGFEWKNDASPY